MKSRPVTNREKKFVADNYKTMSDKQMGKSINRTHIAVLHIRNKLGLKRLITLVLSEEDKIFIRNNYLTKSDERIGFIIKKSVRSIFRYRQNKGLTKELRVEHNRVVHFQMKSLVNFCTLNPNSIFIESAKYELKKLSGL